MESLITKLNPHGSKTLYITPTPTQNIIINQDHSSSIKKMLEFLVGNFRIFKSEFLMTQFFTGQNVTPWLV